MVSCIWHGYTSFSNADLYETLLKEEIFTGIKDRRIEGYKGTQLFRRKLDKEEEFITVMWFENLDAVRIFAGEDYEACVVAPKARAILSGSMSARSTMK